MGETTQSGKAAEIKAAQYLIKQGLQLISQNYRSRFGEIDLIMRDGPSLVFIEVRMRNSKQFGGAIASITLQKQRKIALTAEQYLQQAGNQACRFDVILIDHADKIEWIKQAFEV